MQGLKLHSVLDPQPDQLSYFESFLAQEIALREKNLHFNKENYDDSKHTGLRDLVVRGRFRSGGLTWVEDQEANILALSGFYALNKVMICGVRTLVALKKPMGLIGVHASHILPCQIQKAQEQGLCAAVVTFNPNNFRMAYWIEENKLKKQALRVYQDFCMIQDEILFNHVRQKIMWKSLSEEGTERYVTETLSGEMSRHG